jgi:hypothetical protein
VGRIDVEVERARSELALTYFVTGRTRDLMVAGPAAARTDGLWRSTCFEAFVRAGGEGYLELNFAPSGAWAAYRFDGYREGMAEADVSAPRIAAASGEGVFELVVRTELAGDLAAAPLTLALTAVIEERGGAKSYWALAHPEGRPDFHHAAGFTLPLPLEGRG